MKKTECDVCRTFHEKTSVDLPEIVLDEGSGIGVLKLVKNNIFVRQLIPVILFCVILIAIVIFSEYKVFWFSTDRIEVERLYQMKNGNIYYRLKPDKNCRRGRFSDITVPESERMKLSQEGFVDI